MVAFNTVAICGQCGKAGAGNVAKTVENTSTTSSESLGAGATIMRNDVG